MEVHDVVLGCMVVSGPLFYTVAFYLHISDWAKRRKRLRQQLRQQQAPMRRAR